MKTVKLSKQAILDIFEKAANPVDAIIELFKAVIPWDDIEFVSHHPIVSNETWKFICDRGTNKWEVDFGLTWMNKGFCGREDLKDWVAYIPKDCYTLTVKSVPQIDMESLTGSYAQVGVEEFGTEPDYDGAGFGNEDKYEEQAMKANGD